MFSYHTYKNNNKGKEEIWGDYEYGYGLDGGDGSIDITYPQTYQVVYINKYSFLHFNHTSIKWFLKKRAPQL